MSAAKRASEASSAEQLNEGAKRANKRMEDKWPNTLRDDFIVILLHVAIWVESSLVAVGLLGSNRPSIPLAVKCYYELINFVINSFILSWKKPTPIAISQLFFKSILTRPDKRHKMRSRSY